jgi:hypothetical protein
VLVAASACGGNVKGNPGTPGEQLRGDVAGLCETACTTVVKCPGATGSSCDCGCACPADESNCECAPCTCPESEPVTRAACESDCSDAVQHVLDGAPQCEATMLKLLDCLASAPCEGSGTPCRAENDAMQSCVRVDRSTTPPSVTGVSADPGTPGTIGASAVVRCQISGGGGVVSGPGAAPPAPGDLVCLSGWDSCSDGGSYKVECRVGGGADLDCTCLVNDTAQSSFTAAACPATPSDANEPCGWYLE